MKNKLSLISGLVAAQGHPEAAQMLKVSKNARNNVLFQQSLPSIKNYYAKRIQFRNHLKTQSEAGYQSALQMLTSGNAKASVLNTPVVPGWSPLLFVLFYPRFAVRGTPGEARFRAVQRALVKEMIDKKAKFKCRDRRMCSKILLKLLEIGSPEGIAQIRNEGFVLSYDDFISEMYQIDEDFDTYLYSALRFPTNLQVIKELKDLLPWFSLSIQPYGVNFMKVVKMVNMPNHLQILRTLIEHGFNPYQRDWVEEGLVEPYIYYNLKGGTNPEIVALLTPPQPLWSSAPSENNNNGNNFNSNTIW